ncbi:MAG: hypothetical protein IPK87_15810 [Planctomycetes bacterium]|nr:hypothetical protein [Planctomycetota bacterium]
MWSRNEHTGEEGYKPVVTLFRNTSNTLVHLTYTSGSAGVPPAAGADFQSAPAAGTAAIHTSTHTLTGTPEHPFWSITRNDPILGVFCTGLLELLRNRQVEQPQRFVNDVVLQVHARQVSTYLKWVLGLRWRDRGRGRIGRSRRCVGCRVRRLLGSRNTSVTLAASSQHQRCAR